MEAKPESKNKSSNPTSVRFTPETETRLKAMLSDSLLSFPQVLDFAVNHLLDELSSGKEIRLYGKKLQLVKSFQENGASEASLVALKLKQEREASSQSTSSGSKRKTR